MADSAMESRKRPRVAVWKFASCDGCQLSLLDCEEELLEVADAIEIAFFPEATRRTLPGPYDVSLVEGSISTPEDLERIQHIRDQSTYLVTIGACATAGGIQALRNYRDIGEVVAEVYARPEYIDTLDKSVPIGEHVRVDFELRGCPINKRQLLQTIVSLVNGRAPTLAKHSVCVDCKLKGNNCVLVTRGIPCLGPVTQTGCDALCPSYNRGCFGCFGPMESPNPDSLSPWLEQAGASAKKELARLYRGFSGYAEAFRVEADRLERESE